MSTLAKKNLARYETALAERDRARDLAARLEADNARLRERNEKQFDEILRLHTEAENRRLNGDAASATDPAAADDPWSVQQALLTEIRDAVRALRPRVTVRNVEYRTTGNVADIIDELSRCEQDGRLRDLGHC